MSNIRFHLTQISVYAILHMLMLNGYAYDRRGGEGGGRGRDTPYNGLYRNALPEKGTCLRLGVYKRVGISQVEE